MKTLLKIFGVLFLLGSLATIFNDSSTTSKTKKVNTIENKKEKNIKQPFQSTIDVIQKNLDIEGEDRWVTWKVGYNRDEKNIYIQVAADPIANSTAINSYIDLIKHIHNKHASKFNLVGRVYQMGDLKENCFVNGKE